MRIVSNNFPPRNYELQNLRLVQFIQPRLLSSPDRPGRVGRRRAVGHRDPLMPPLGFGLSLFQTPSSSQNCAGEMTIAEAG